MDKTQVLMRLLARVAVARGLGENAYVVGGAVRNYLIGQPVKDVDVVVDSITAPPLTGGEPRDSAWFARCVRDALPASVDLTTNQYGVAILTVKTPCVVDGVQLKGEVIEIANARKESYGGEEGKGYKPHTVAPATIWEDLYRREFTFNTLLWRLGDLLEGPEGAEVLDLTGVGLHHLEQRLMVCPRNPDVVFSDDPTRLLRAIKFTAKYGFTIAEETASAIQRNAGSLVNAPWEAVGTILVENILTAPNLSTSLDIMEQLGLLPVVMDIIEGSKPFQAYLAGQLRQAQVDPLILNRLINKGLVAKTPISFLSYGQRLQMAHHVRYMTGEQAQAYIARLKHPGVDNRAYISEFGLRGRDCGKPSSIAREVLLDDPHVGDLDSVVREKFLAWYNA